MRIVALDHNPENVRVFTDDGQDITNDLQLLGIDIHIAPDCSIVANMHCLIDSFDVVAALPEDKTQRQPEEFPTLLNG